MNGWKKGWKKVGGRSIDEEMNDGDGWMEGKVRTNEAPVRFLSSLYPMCVLV